MVSTISSAPPESASRFANIAPNAIKMPTPAAVLPNPSVNDFQHVGEVSPATMPTVSPPKISARNGCSFTTVIRDDDEREAGQRGKDELPAGRDRFG